MNPLTPFKTLVKERCGLHLEGLAEERLAKALTQLRTAHALPDLQATYHLLERRESLFAALISQLTVNETYFFREPEQLDLVADTLVPRLLERRTDRRPLRLLSAGCSSGEEPYSLAMALHERYGERTRALFHIDGGDLDSQAVAKARRAEYSGLAFRTLSAPRRQRYFTPLGARYQLTPAIRDLVNFQELNLLSAALPEASGQYDVILFRNVSIYFSPETRRCIQARLKQWLKPDGILLCGTAETLGNDLGVFQLIEENGLFYFMQQPTGSPTSLVSRPVSTPVSMKVPATPFSELPELKGPALEAPAPPDPAKTCEEIREHLQAEHWEHAEQTLETRLAQHPDCRESRLLKAYLLFNRKAFEEANALLASLLEETPWSVDTLMLAGLVARWQQAPEVAARHFRHAIYVAPECWPAHFYLADIYRMEAIGKDAAVRAQRGYSAVQRLLGGNRQPATGLVTIPPPLPPGDACFLAQRHLASLADLGRHATTGAS